MFEFEQGDILIKSLFEIYNLSFLKINKQIGCHTNLILKAKVIDSKNIMEHINQNSSIEVYLYENIAFIGKISSLKQSIELESFDLELSAHGYSSLLDTEKKMRSFQDKSNIYSQIFTQIICEEYDGIFKNADDRENLQKNMYIQYNETDWEFLKRLASYNGSYLVTNDTYTCPAIYLGNVKRKLYPFAPSSKINRIKKFSNKNYPDNEYLQLESDLILNLSDGISMDNLNWWVIEAVHSLELDIIKSRYLLTQDEKLKNPHILYNQLGGTSLGGKIINVTEDKIKLHLEIDQTQEMSKAKWHPFSTSYSAENHVGWYVMPQIGDQAMLYFPNELEDNAFIKNIYRSLDGENKRYSNPDVKYWGTYDEKELKMDSESLKISANEDYIYTKLSEDNGIDTYSIHDMKISAGNDLYFIGNTISIKAKQGDLEILNGNSKIKINKNTTIKSTIIKEKGNAK